MDGDEPVGGRWNFDTENREPPPADVRPPAPYRPREDDIDAQVVPTWTGCGWTPSATTGRGCGPPPTTRPGGRWPRFTAQRLADFGRWQDAMLAGEQLMWHSHVSAALNLGLLDPMECVEAALAVEDAPLNAVEGFVRQVIGWREYVWGTYWLFGDRWESDNALEADADLPAAFWDGDTDMRCLSESVQGLRDTGYAHHIQRLMVFGNLVDAPRRGAAPGLRLVPRELHRRLSVGDGAERAGHGHLGRRRAHVHQALRRRRPLHRPHVRLLRRVPVRPHEADRRRRVPVHARCTGTSSPGTGGAWRGSTACRCRCATSSASMPTSCGQIRARGPARVRS